MSTINQLPLATSISGGDQLIVFLTNQGGTYRVPASLLLDYFETNFTPPGFAPYDLAATTYTPGSAFSLTLVGTEHLWIILKPATTLASGTLILPTNLTAPDGQEVMVTTTQQITSFSLLPNGATTIYGAPAALAADGHFRVRYEKTSDAWYRIA